MTLEKKVLVLRPVDSVSEFNSSVSGIARLEKDDASTSFHLSVVNVSSISGEYLCAVIDSNKTPYFFSLGKRPNVFRKELPFSFDLKRGFAVGLAIVFDFIPVTVAFSSTKELNFTLSDLKKAFAEYCIENREDAISQNPHENTGILSAYNDELVATENYYEKEKDDVSSKDDEFIVSRQEEKEESKTNDNGANDEANSFSGEKYCTDSPYYHSVQRELDSLFNSFPEDNSLKWYFPNGKFVRINYSEKRYYLAGVISENDQPKYICYGVPSTFSPQPPNELKGHATFIPLSLSNATGNGFWVIYQSAISGKCEKIEDVKP